MITGWRPSSVVMKSPGFGTWLRVADEQPGVAEDALHFQFEQVWIGIDAAVHAAGLDELGDVVGVAVAHAEFLKRYPSP